MTADNVNRLMGGFSPYIDKVSENYVRLDLEKIDDQYFDNYADLKFKNHRTVTLLSIFLGLFGVHRMYAREWGTGIFKAVLAVYLICSFVFTNFNTGIGGIFFYCYVVPPFAITVGWYILDLFIVPKKVYTINLSSINLLTSKIKRGKV